MEKKRANLKSVTLEKIERAIQQSATPEAQASKAGDKVAKKFEKWEKKTLKKVDKDIKKNTKKLEKMTGGL